MKFKRDIIIITLIIVMIFTISSVCAADSEIQAVDACNSTDTVVDTVDDNDLEVNDVDEILNVTNDFDDLYDEINGNQSKTYIELERDYHGSYDGGNGIPIERENLVIDGKGHTIDCTGENSRIFNIRADGVTLKDIIFSGGYSNCGGAVYTSKNLIIINCTFKENQATGVDVGGGAVYGDDVRMSIYDCTFTDNRAANGGAICAMGENSNDCEIFNCTFTAMSPIPMVVLFTAGQIAVWER